MFLWNILFDRNTNEFIIVEIYVKVILLNLLVNHRLLTGTFNRISCDHSIRKDRKVGRYDLLRAFVTTKLRQAVVEVSFDAKP